ncbi:tetratricopeptide repeat protein [Microbacterium sp.]|uniref:tetratricopeptide repeat protein n=1 Tax=Microbacterium sp. TaxID=51671 RepID=UPI003A92BAAD
MFLWLADLAADAGAKDASLTFVNTGIAGGAHPLGYWEIRRYWLESELGQASQRKPRDVRHPLVVAQDLELDGLTDDAVEVVREWEPTTVREKTTRSLMLARIAYGRREFDDAIELGRSLHATTGNPSAALVAARAMIARQTFEASGLHHADLAGAFRLLIQTRDDLRRWGEDTAEVIVAAVTAARLLNNQARALSLTDAEPHGEATPSEAASKALRTLRATMLAENGILDLAKDLLAAGEVERADAALLRALIADAEGDRAAATAQYSEALEATADFEEKGQLAVRLAHYGVLHSFVEEQRLVGNEAWADQLTLIAEAFGGVDGGLDRLKAAAHSSAQYSLTLSQVYEAHGDQELQLQTLQAAAMRLEDADTWLATARLEKKTGLTAEAIHSAQEALRVAPESWGATARTQGLLIELFSIRGDWDQAVRSAKHYVRLLPGDVVAIWTLITCQHHAGELDAALRTWHTLPSRRRPTHRTHVLVWISLYQQFGEAIGTVHDLHNVAAEWAQDEEIRRQIVGLVILPDRTQRTTRGVNSSGGGVLDGAEEPAESAADQTTEGELPSIEETLINEYFRDFPDGAIQRLTLNLEQDDSLLDQLVAAIGTRPDTSELDDQVFRGYFPLGLICDAHGSTLTEAVISHASGVRFASTGSDEERARAQDRVGGGVIVDITALFALSRLPNDLRSSLMGAFSSLVIAAEQFRDAVSAAQAIGRYGHAGPSLGRWRGPVALRSRTGAQTLLDAARIDELLAFIRPLDRASRSTREASSEASAFEDDVWFAAATVAGSSRALWSDDAALNRIAEDFGVATFSTVALLDALLSTGVISANEAALAREVLLVERYLGIPFDDELYDRALNSREDAALDIASVVEHLGGYDANDILSFALRSAGSLTADGPRLEAWISACTRWLVRISPDEAARRENLNLFAAHLTSVHWFLPQTFSFVDAGVQDGLDGLTAEDPLLGAVDRVFSARKRRDERSAALWLFELVAAVDASVRPRYTGLAFRR